MTSCVWAAFLPPSSSGIEQLRQCPVLACPSSPARSLLSVCSCSHACRAVSHSTTSVDTPLYTEQSYSNHTQVHSSQGKGSWAGSELQQCQGEQGWELFERQLLKLNRGLNKFQFCSHKYLMLNAFPYQAVGMTSTVGRLRQPF